MVNRQIQIVYEIEGLLLLAKESEENIYKCDEINALIDTKLLELSHIRHLSTGSAPCDECKTNQHEEIGVTKHSEILVESNSPIELDNIVDTNISETTINAKSDKDFEEKIESEEIVIEIPNFGDGEDVVESKPKDEIIVENIEESKEVDQSDCNPGASTTRNFPFTLNDKFRFRRELFGNSDSEYRETLNHLQSFSNYEEAYKYFIDELGLDIDSTEVTDFFEIVKNGYDW